jgi:hypothetical protein
MKTITYSELKRLSFINSKKLPKKVVIGKTVHEWVGIGWIPIPEKPNKNHTKVIE